MAIDLISGTKEYLCDALGDTRPTVKFGGDDAVTGPKFVPNANMSFSCFSGAEKYFINLNRKDRVVTTEVEALADGVLSLRIGDQSDIWQTDENGKLKWDIRFETKPLTNIFNWELLCSPNLEFLYQPELTPEEIEMKAQRPENAIGSYAVYCNLAGHLVNPDGSTRENYLTGKLLHIYRPLVTDDGGKTCWAELFIDPGQNLLRITIPQEFLDSAVYPVTLDPDFGYTSAGASYAEITYPYAHDYAAAKHTAGPDETIIKYTAFCATLSAGFLDVAAYTDGPTTRIDTAAGIDCVNNIAQWRSSPAVSHAMSNGVTYCCAVGDQSSAPICFYDGSSSEDTSRHATPGPLPATWNEAQTYYVRFSLYATYEFAVYNDAVIPVEFQATAGQNGQSPLDFLIIPQQDAQIPVEWFLVRVDSIREQIIQAITTKLADIRTTNGYQTDIGALVERARFGFGPQELPAASVFPLAESAEKRYGKSQQSMPVLIEGQVLHESSDPSAIAEKILDDLIKCLTGVEKNLSFTDGGPYEIKAGDVITGFTSAASGRVVEVTVSSGSWAGEDAAGTLRLRLQAGTFQAENLNIGQVVPEDRGITWTDLGQQASQASIRSFAHCGSGICLAGTANDGKILRSTDYGATWSDLGQQFSQTHIHSLAYLENGIALAGAYPDGKILRSTNYGAAWADLGQQFSQTHIPSLAYLGDGVCLAGASDGKILRSTNYGATWQDLGQQGSQLYILSLAYCGGGICLAGTGTGGKILRSTNYGATWQDLGQQGSQPYIYSLAYLTNGICLAGTANTSGKILRSTDYGATWQDLGQQFSQTYIDSLVYLGDGICLAGTGTGGKILRSTNYGATWQDLGQQASQSRIHALAHLGSGRALAGTGTDGKILRCADLSIVATAAGNSVYIERLGGLTDQIAYSAGGPENYPGSGDQATGCPVTFVIKYTTRVGNPYLQ